MVLVVQQAWTLLLVQRAALQPLQAVTVQAVTEAEVLIQPLPAVTVAELLLQPLLTVAEAEAEAVALP